MESQEMTFFDTRITRIEDLVSQQQTSIATLTGDVQSLTNSVGLISEKLDKLSNNTDKSGLMQKALVGMLIVQSLLHGVTTPDVAKAAITQLFTGGTH